MPSGSVIRAVDHPYRRNILHILTKGALTYSQLFANMEPRGGGRGRFNYHLKVLREAGLIQNEQDQYGLTSTGDAAVTFLEEVSKDSHNPVRFNRQRRGILVAFSLLFAGILGGATFLAILSSQVPTESTQLLPEGLWGSPTLIVRDEAYWSVAAGSPGNGLVVWVALGPGGNESIFGRFLTPKGGWSNATLIGERLHHAVLTEHRVAQASDGSAIVMWTEGNTGLVARHYSPETGWGNPTVLHGEEVIAGLAMSSSGEAVAVWEASGQILAKRFVTGSGWLPHGTVDPDGGVAGRYGFPRVGLDRIGNALVVWEGRDGGRNLQANRYTVGVGWGTPVSISEGARSLWGIDLAVDSSGQGAVVWFQHDGNDPDGNELSLYANRFAPSSGWDGPKKVSVGSPRSFVGYPNVITSAEGQAIVTWQERKPQDELNSTWSQSIMARRFVPGVGWEKPALVAHSTGTSSGLSNCHASSGDGDGRAIAVWQDPGDTVSHDPPAVYAARFVPGHGWSLRTPVVRVSATWTFRGCPDLALDPDGNGLIVWGQAGSDGSVVYSNQFTAPSPSDELLQDVRSHLEFANRRLAAFETRFLFLAGLAMTLVVLTAGLFLLYWNLRRGLALLHATHDEITRPPRGGG